MYLSERDCYGYRQSNGIIILTSFLNYLDFWGKISYFMKMDSLETTLEYRNGAAIIHLGTEVDERVLKTEEFIKETAEKAKGLILDYRYVINALSRDGSLIIIANSSFDSRGIYLCNTGKNIKGLEFLGITDMPGIYKGKSIDEAVKEISQN